MELTHPLGLVVFLVALLVVTDISILAHELAHAVVALVTTDAPVVLRMGRRPALWKGRIGRFVFELNPLPAQRGRRAGEVLAFTQTATRSARIVFFLAGPVSGALPGLALLALGLSTHLAALAVAGACCAPLSLLSLIPFNPKTDGARLVRAIRGVKESPPDPFALAYSRWLILFTDLRKTLTQAQLLQLGGAPVAVGYSSDDRSDAAVGLWRLACAGWCWREAEQRDVSAIRARILDARQAAERRESIRDEIAVSAAREIAAGTADDPDLEPAFERLRPGFSHAPSGDDHERFAFRFGVALHDVERVAG